LVTDIIASRHVISALAARDQTEKSQNKKREGREQAVYFSKFESCIHTLIELEFYPRQAVSSIHVSEQFAMCSHQTDGKMGCQFACLCTGRMCCRVRRYVS
jgi:hypothetical protein